MINITASMGKHLLSFFVYHFQRFPRRTTFGLRAVNQKREIFFAKRGVGVVVVDFQTEVGGFLLGVNHDSLFPSEAVYGSDSQMRSAQASTLLSNAFLRRLRLCQTILRREG